MGQEEESAKRLKDFEGFQITEGSSDARFTSALVLRLTCST